MPGALLVVTPLRKELDALLRVLEAQQLHADEHVLEKSSIYIFPDIGVILGLGGHGKVQFALRTQHLLQQFPDVRLVICAGVAGSLVEHLQAGDVVVASETIEHDYKERFDKTPAPRFPGDPATLAALQCIPSSERRAQYGFNLHFGIIASGDEDVIAQDRARQLHRETQALAVAWEGAGGARACRFYDKPFVEIRGITDNANTSASQDFLINLEKSMKNVGYILGKKIWNDVHASRRT